MRLAALRARVAPRRRWHEASALRRDMGGWRTWLLYPPGPGPRMASWLRKRWVLFRNPRADIRIGAGSYLGPGFSLHMPFGGTFVVGEGSEFRRGFRAELAGPSSRITIGRWCAFTYDVIIQCAGTVAIGDHCMFGQATMIVDGNHRFRDLTRPMLHQGYELRPITISDHATVTTKCTIIADVGERAFVGAGAVVLRPVPPFCVVGGVPARVLEYFGPAGQDPPDVSSRSIRADSAGT